jgi:hypothetical protein
MARMTEISAEEAVARAHEEAEKLTRALDQANEERRLKPLMSSRDTFVKLMTSQLAKLFVHHAVIKS